MELVSGNRNKCGSPFDALDLSWQPQEQPLDLSWQPQEQPENTLPRSIRTAPTTASVGTSSLTTASTVSAARQWLKSDPEQEFQKISKNSFKCLKCQKEFKRISFVKDHLLTHNNPNPFQCDVCKKNHNNRSNLRQHKQLHSDIKNYQCPLCELDFKTNRHCHGHLIYHHKDQHGTKPINKIKSQKQTLFKCPCCPREFISSYGCTLHLENKHPSSTDAKPIRK